MSAAAAAAAVEVWSRSASSWKPTLVRKRGLLHCGYRLLVHTTSIFLPVFLATHGQTTHLLIAAPNHLSYLCRSSLYISCLPSTCSFFLLLSSTIQKGTNRLLNPLFSVYLFLPLDLFFHGVEWFLRPVFFPALLKRSVTSLWQAIGGNWSLRKSPWFTEAEPALCSVGQTCNYWYRHC